MHVVSAVRLRRWAIRGLSKAHLTVHRVTRGRVLGSLAGMPVLLLTTTGRRSGNARTTPLTFFRDGADLVVIASNGGADRPPDWSLNLQQTPRAVVRIGADKLVVTARPASAQERERLWVVITGTYAGYALYQERDNTTDTGRPSHTRRPARRTSPVNLHVEAARYQRRLDAVVISPDTVDQLVVSTALMQTRCKRTTQTREPQPDTPITTQPPPARRDGTGRHLPTMTTQRSSTQEANKELR